MHAPRPHVLKPPATRLDSTLFQRLWASHHHSHIVYWYTTFTLGLFSHHHHPMSEPYKNQQRVYTYPSGGEAPLKVDRTREDLSAEERDSSREVSNETSWGICEFARLSAMSGMPKLVSVQNSYSLLVRGNFETDLAEVREPRSVRPFTQLFYSHSTY